MNKLFLFPGPPGAAPQLWPTIWPDPPISIYWPWPAICIQCPCPQSLPVLAAKLYFWIFDPNLCLLVLALRFYLSDLIYNFISRSGPGICIYQLCFFNLCLYLRRWSMICINRTCSWISIYLTIGSSSSGSCNSSSNNFFGIDNTNICMSILVN